MVIIMETKIEENKKEKRCTMLISLYFSKADYKLIKDVCSARRGSMVEFVKACIFKELARLGYLPKYQVKALGVKEGDKDEGSSS